MLASASPPFNEAITIITIEIPIISIPENILTGVDGKKWINIGDVSGHGVTAGLIMMMLQTATSTSIKSDENLTPKDLMLKVNKVLSDNIRNRLLLYHYVTICFLQFDDNGNFFHCGLHLDIIIYRKSDQKIELLRTGDVWLGLEENISDTVENRNFRLNSGDLMLIYTDGVTEAINKNREFYTTERLINFVEKNHNETVDLMSKSLETELSEFMGEQLDDITYLFIKKN